MAEFSYSSDIAPLRGNYFADVASARGLSDTERKLLSSRYSSSLKSSLAEESKAMESMINTQRQQLEFEKTKLALDAAKRETKNQLEAEALYPEIMSKLTSVLEDQTSDTPTKVLNIEKIRAGYGKVGIENPTINNIFNASSSALTVKDQKEALKNSVASSLAGAGQADAVKAWFGGNVESGSAKEFYDASKSVEQAQQKEKSEERKAKSDLELQKALLEQQKQIKDLDIKVLDNYESALRSMVPKGTSEDDLLSLIQTGQMKPKKGDAKAEPTKPSFNPLHVAEMKEIMLDLNPSLKPQDIEGVPHEQLYSYAFRRLKQQRRGYIPTAPRKTTQSLFEE